MVTNISPTEFSEANYRRNIQALNLLSIVIRKEFTGHLSEVDNVIREKKSVLCASNHLGELETVLIPVYLINRAFQIGKGYESRFHAVSKPYNFSWGSKDKTKDSLAGRWLRGMGTYELNRSHIEGKQDRDAKHLLPISECLNRGDNIYFCPQGHRGKLKTSAGLGYILSQCEEKVTIIPAKAEGNCNLLSALCKPFTRHLKIEFGMPFEFDIKKYEKDFMICYHDALLKEVINSSDENSRFGISLPYKEDLDDQIVFLEHKIERVLKNRPRKTYNYRHPIMREGTYWTIYENVYRKISEDTI